MNIQVTANTTDHSNLLIPVGKDKFTKNVLQQISETYGVDLNWLEQDFKGNSKSLHTFYGTKATKSVRITLLGLGENPTFQAILEAFRHFSHQNKQGGHLAIDVQNFRWRSPSMEVTLDALAGGLCLGQYDIGLYKSVETKKIKLKTVALVLDESYHENAAKILQKGLATATTQCEIFDLVNAPANKKVPETLATWALQSGKKYGYNVQVFNKREIEKQGFDALLAVNRGSEEPPYFIVMVYTPKVLNGGEPKVGLVGKGVTYDTGGLSIKTAGMHYMKSDMGGAAAVLGTMEVAAKLQLPVHLVGIVPTTDNCVDAASIKPGDVIDSYSGLTIEVIDTDAEGRLILADGLFYLQEQFKPDVMIDVATLTGSCVRALGYEAAGLFTTNDDLAKDLSKAGGICGENVWRLPMWEKYGSGLKSDIADVRNYSGRPIAGAIEAAKFLEYFINKHPKWAHLDIAGVAFGDTAFSKYKSSTGFGIRLLQTYLEELV